MPWIPCYINMIKFSIAIFTERLQRQPKIFNVISFGSTDI